jgi:glycosyltransferase involved in cell wall biosynthesis
MLTISILVIPNHYFILTNIFVKIKVNYLKKILELRFQVKKTSNEGHKIVFQNLKPALFSFGLWNAKNGIVISDFSHSLFEWCKKKSYKKNKRFYSQRILYQQLYKILTFTDNLKANLEEVYNISSEKLYNVPIPLDFENYYQVPQPVGAKPKVLFVGGEFNRKGGNHILNAWESKLKGKCELTILTNSKIEAKEGIHVFNDVSKGSQEHISIFQSSDIFILPTDRDAYPIVLGEAAVSSLAIITTQYAFGAKNIIHKSYI